METHAQKYSLPEDATSHRGPRGFFLTPNGWELTQGQKLQKAVEMTVEKFSSPESAQYAAFTIPELRNKVLGFAANATHSNLQGPEESGLPEMGRHRRPNRVLELLEGLETPLKEGTALVSDPVAGDPVKNKMASDSEDPQSASVPS